MLMTDEFEFSPTVNRTQNPAFYTFRCSPNSNSDTGAKWEKGRKNIKHDLNHEQL